MKHWLFATLLFACGGSKGQAPVQPGPGPNGPTEVTEGAESGSAVAKTDALEEKDCQALFEHVFQIAVTLQQESLPEEQRATAADIDKAKAAMQKELLGQCVGADRVEFHYACAMEATDRAGLQACVGPE